MSDQPKDSQDRPWVITGYGDSYKLNIFEDEYWGYYEQDVNNAAETFERIFAAGKEEAREELEAMRKKADGLERALELIKSIYEHHPDAGTLEMPQIADLLYNQAINALAEYRKEGKP